MYFFPSSILSLPLIAVVFVVGCGEHSNNTAEKDNSSSMADNGMIGSGHRDLDTYDGVVEDIVDRMDEKSKELMRQVTKKDLLNYYLTWGKDIRNHYKVWTNEKLTRSCARHLGKDDDMEPEDASLVIMEGVWLRLQK